MAATARILPLACLAGVMITLPACRGVQRETARCGVGPVCLPPLEAPAPVGTATGEVATKDFVLRVHDVRDILDLMPVIQRVDSRGVRTVPADDALIAELLEVLTWQERSITALRATDSGAVVVKAPPPIQEKVAKAIHDYRTILIHREVDAVGMPSPSSPASTPSPAAPAPPASSAPPAVPAATTPPAAATAPASSSSPASPTPQTSPGSGARAVKR